ncbi:ABC transporter permease [Chitinophaga sp.]|uniref:ABC transporter permease n=1 Tax=Chitinophaga sp. TaxID=1869181 RepID=UPI00260B3C22|nr:ABC transporter permease [uncultured Chitinophaga sp.]
MLTNYIKTAKRSLLKHRFHSILNITGLATGIAFAMLVLAYVWSELQVNRGLKNASRQHILLSKWKDPNMGFELATFGNLAVALKEEYPSLVADYYRFDGIIGQVNAGDKAFRENLAVGDSTLLKMYGFEAVSGDAPRALENAAAVVITDRLADKFFGEKDVAGRTLEISNFAGKRQLFTIGAVIREPAKNSVTCLDARNENGIFLPAAALPFFGREMNTWNNPFIVNLVELREGVTAADLEKPMASLVKRHTGAEMAAQVRVEAVPLQDFYLNSGNGLVKRMLYTLSGIALFILLMAIINFVNLSVSRASSRMKEIGVRKALGGRRKQLIWQFLVESGMLVLVAAAVGIGMYFIVKGPCGQLLGKELPGPGDFPAYFIAFPFALVLVTGLAAGLYPAFVLSSLRVTDSLKGKLKASHEKTGLRKSLVGFQYLTAAVVLVAAFIITRQVQLFFSNQLGYDKSYLVSLPLPRDWTPEGYQRMQNFRGQLSQLPQVQSASVSFEIPDGNNGGSINVFGNGRDSANAITTYQLYADEYYGQTYGMQLAAGRFFNDPGQQTPAGAIVINETLSRRFGWNNAADAIGKQLRVAGFTATLTVAGVVRDFHFSSMQQAVQPIVFVHPSATNIYRYMSLKLAPGAGIAAQMQAIRGKWESLMPGAPFEYKFTDEMLERMYNTELRLKYAAYTATGLALVIVLLGVTGLISFSIQKRTKEIGVRKVLGASVGSIITLFVKEFLKVIAVAMLVAIPAAYFIMNYWLNDYVYRIGITPYPFFAAFMMLAAVTAVLIFVQTFRAANANPVKSLRTE